MADNENPSCNHILQQHINIFLITHLHPVVTKHHTTLTVPIYTLHIQFSEMSQRVPNCDVDDNNNNVPTPTRVPLLPNFNFISHEVPMLSYKAAEGTLRNQTTWDKPRTGGGTLESIINQRVNENRYKLMSMDALVPAGEFDTCGTTKDRSAHVAKEEVGKRAGMVARVATTQELSGCKDWSVSGSETCRELSVTFNSATMGSPENTISSGKQYTGTTANDDRDSITISHRMSLSEVPDEDYKVTKVDRSSGSNKRIKAAATHNQSERRRRDKINQRMKELQKLVPNSSKTDKASMLDEVIQYMKQLQTQVQMMNWMKMYCSMMMPITMQQQQQQQLKLMSMMMGHMGMGMGMNKDMVMNMNSMNIPGMLPNMLPFPPFMPMASCGDPLQRAPEKSATMDAYSKMAAMYQQMFNPEASSSKN